MSAPSENSTTGIFPMRLTPSMVLLSSALSGISTDFSATVPGASADSTSAPSSAVSSRRAVISTSGSSGIAKAWQATREPRRRARFAGMLARVLAEVLRLAMAGAKIKSAIENPRSP